MVDVIGAFIADNLRLRFLIGSIMLDDTMVIIDTSVVDQHARDNLAGCRAPGAATFCTKFY